MIAIGLFRKENASSVDKWPKDNLGNSERAVFLCHLSSNDMADELLVNLLDAFGIPAVRQYPGDGDFGKVILGMSGYGTDLYVPESMYEDALNLYNNREEVSDEQLL